MFLVSLVSDFFECGDQWIKEMNCAKIFQLTDLHDARTWKIYNFIWLLMNFLFDFSASHLLFVLLFFSFHFYFVLCSLLVGAPISVQR